MVKHEESVSIKHISLDDLMKDCPFPYSKDCLEWTKDIKPVGRELW